jgi:hypothetical protein
MLAQFVDKVQIECMGGRGGNGCVSFEGMNEYASAAVFYYVSLSSCLLFP